MPLIDPSGGVNMSNYNALLTTTLERFSKTMVDNFSDASPTIWWLTQSGRKQHFSGGVALQEPIMYAGVPVQAFSGYDELRTEPAEGMVPATFIPKKYTVPIVIDRDSETDNMGEAQIIDILEAKIQQAEISIKEQINYDLIMNGYAGSTAAIGTATPDPKKITGILDFLQDTNQARPYGGISSSSNTWWQNQLVNHAAAGAATMISNMEVVYRRCSRGNDVPDLILCSEDAYAAYQNQLVDDKRYVNTMAGDAGFQSLMYNATTMMFDRDVPNDTMFFLNSRYIKLRVHSAVDMKAMPFRESESRWARFSRIMWKGELVCNNRARQGLLHNLGV